MRIFSTKNFFIAETLRFCDVTMASTRQRLMGVNLLLKALCYVCGILAIVSPLHAFSVLVPESQIFGKRELEGSGTLRKEIPLATLLKQSEDYRGNIFKRVKVSNDNKPATCTCTCETKPTNEGEGAHKRLLSSASKLRSHHQKHHEAPATCTCSCETHPIDEDKEVKNKIVDSAMDQSPSLFWSPFDYESPMNDQPEEKQTDYSSKDSEQNGYEDTWGHSSRYPWRRLPDTICYRDQCATDNDCCMRYNICDRSAKVCVDCWYGASCTSEKDCCFKYPICKMETYRSHSGVPGEMVTSGKCVDKV